MKDQDNLYVNENDPIEYNRNKYKHLYELTSKYFDVYWELAEYVKQLRIIYYKNIDFTKYSYIEVENDEIKTLCLDNNKNALNIDFIKLHSNENQYTHIKCNRGTLDYNIAHDNVRRNACKRIGEYNMFIETYPEMKPIFKKLIEEQERIIENSIKTYTTKINNLNTKQIK